MNTRNSLTPTGTVQRVIDFRINVWHLAGAACTALIFGINSYMKQEKLVDAVNAQTAEITQLKQEVKTGNTSMYAMNSSLSLMQFRLETAESEIRVLKTTPPAKK